MKKIILVILFICLSSIVAGQTMDEKVQENHKIKEVTDYLPHKMNQTTDFSFASMSVFGSGSYSIDNFSHTKTQNNNSFKPNPKSYSRFRAAIGGGLGYRLAAISSDITSEFLRQYMKKLKLGYQFNLDLAGYFNSYVGLGVKASIFRASNSVWDVYYVDPLTGMTVPIGEMSNNMMIIFAAPAVSVRFIHGRRDNALMMSAGIGYLHYRDKGVLISPFLQNGWTVGVSYDIGYDFRVSEFFLLGLQGGFTLGTLSQYRETVGNQTTTYTLDANSQESLFRVDFSVGLRFSKSPDRYHY
jgi:hypothetical protein